MGSLFEGDMREKEEQEPEGICRGAGGTYRT